MTLINSCIDQNVGRRRVFWTTRAAACGVYNSCGEACEIPGLKYEDKDDPYPDQGLPASSGYRTINNDEWLLGLILNILNTRSRTDLNCPSPAAVFGHWSESYVSDGLYIGSTMWNAAEKSYLRVNDAVKAIGAAVTADMQKLVARKVADSVKVEANYSGRNGVDITVTATVSNIRHVLNLSGVMAQGTWVWR